MSALTSQDLETYLPPYGTIPANWDDAQSQLSEIIKRITQAINVRTIGFYLDQQLLTGGQFIPSSYSFTSSTNVTYRSIFRKTIDVGALPNAGTTTIPHGITVDENFTLVQLWGAATKPTSAFSSIPLPYSSPTLNQNIKLNMDATNINITTAIDYSSYTTVFATVEYLLEV